MIVGKFNILNIASKANINVYSYIIVFIFYVMIVMSLKIVYFVAMLTVHHL